MPHRLIAVAGIMGSGKTTLARNLANRLGWENPPDPVNAKKFLDDLFRDHARWAFDAQIAFLTEKATSIISTLRTSRGVVVDRSVDEDINIFARYFFDHGYFDQRSYKTYEGLARYFQASIPNPDLTIYCECSNEVAAERVKQRGREYQQRYPFGYSDYMARAYQDWKDGYDRGPLYAVDSSSVDFRNQDAIDEIVEDILALSAHEGSFQPDMFSSTAVPEPVALKLLQPLIPTSEDWRGIADVEAKKQSVFLPQYPFVYIAAPFTIFAPTATLNHPNDGSSDLFGNRTPHGTIPKGYYRDNLTKVCKALENIGLNSLLPHRDINKWGARILSSRDVFRMCSTQVRNCDAFVGILGNSNGSHLEFGIAMSNGKPCVIVDCEELPNSYITKDLESMEKILSLSCSKISDIPKLIGSDEVRQFLSRWIGV